MSVHVEDPASSEDDAPEDGAQEGTGSSAEGPARKPLGQLAVDAGLISPQQLASAFAEISGSGKRLGEVLVTRRWVDQQQLDRLLAYQDRHSPAPAETEPEEGEADATSEAPGETGRNLDELLADLERGAAAVRRRAARE